MNWNDLRYFLILAEENSLSGAARRLRKEHTTVARRIEALEGTLERSFLTVCRVAGSSLRRAGILFLWLNESKKKP